jgi:transcription elongation factor Elf1
MMGIPYDTKKPYKKLNECHECGEKFKRGQKTVKLEVYDDPWQAEASIIKVHVGNDDGHGDCLDKLSDTSWADFRYFHCEVCGRLIISQCPYNGWRSYVKESNRGEEICVACYQKQVLENGNDIEVFKRGQVPGDFFNSSELSSYNWNLVQGFEGLHITGKDSAKRLCDKARELADKGFKVLVDYDSMGIGGGEGYCSLYYK